MKFGQLIDYNKRKTFFQKSCGTWGRETSSRPHFIFLKSLIWVKASGLQLSFYCFWMFVNKHFTYFAGPYLKKQKWFIVRVSSSYFHMKTKILADFQICISIPLKCCSSQQIRVESQEFHHPDLFLW